MLAEEQRQHAVEVEIVPLNQRPHRRGADDKRQIDTRLSAGVPHCGRGHPVVSPVRAPSGGPQLGCNVIVTTHKKERRASRSKDQGARSAANENGPGMPGRCWVSPELRALGARSAARGPAPPAQHLKFRATDSSPPLLRPKKKRSR